MLCCARHSCVVLCRVGAEREVLKEHFEFRPAFKPIMATNHKPGITGFDHATWRRIRLVPFDVTIPDEDQDKQLPEKLREELPGILNWLIEGCLQWQKEGLGVAPKVRAATDAYRAEEDPIGRFLTDCCVLDPAAKVAAGILHHEYERWCQDEGEIPLGKSAFGKKLSERPGLEGHKGTGGARHWRGVRVREDEPGR